MEICSKYRREEIKVRNLRWKEVKRMKDFIVLIAVIILGLVIGGIVLSLRGKAQELGKKGTSGIDSFIGDIG